MRGHCVASVPVFGKLNVFWETIGIAEDTLTLSSKIGKNAKAKIVGLTCKQIETVCSEI